jgi:hypothetical protein
MAARTAGRPRRNCHDRVTVGALDCVPLIAQNRPQDWADGGNAEGTRHPAQQHFRANAPASVGPQSPLPAPASRLPGAGLPLARRGLQRSPSNSSFAPVRNMPA